jgi:predicted O-methyltransferase YrrM
MGRSLVDNPGAKRTLPMSSALLDAITLSRNGKTQEALAILNRLIDENPGHLDAHGHRAWLYLCLGRYEEAIADYQFIMSDNPRDLEAKLRCAETFLKTGSWSHCLDLLRDVLLLDPYNRRALELWTTCAVGQGATSPADTALDHETKPGRAKPLNPVIQSLEEDPANFPTSVFPQVGQFLYSFVRCVRPQVVVETGCFVGYSTLCIAQALEENGAGHLHSFDLFLPLSPIYRSPVLGACTDALQTARAHLEQAGLAHRVSFHKGDSSTQIRSVFRQPSDCIDMAFIDGDHTVGGCMKDWDAIANALRPGGVAILHDTKPENCGWEGPRYLMDEQCALFPAQFQIVDLPTPEGCGLGIIQKVSSSRKRKWKAPLYLRIRDRILQVLGRQGNK